MKTTKTTPSSEIKIIYQKSTETIRIMPQNHLLCHFDKCGHWICDPDSAINVNISILTFKALVYEGYRFRKHDEIINFINEELAHAKQPIGEKQNECK